LSAKTIVIAAPSPSALARRLDVALAEAGAVVVHVPTSLLVPAADGGVALADAADRLGSYAWVAFTSVTAVAAFADHVRDGRAFGAARVAAVGPATAAALTEHFGIVADVVAGRATGADLAVSLGEAPNLGSSILVPQAADARPELVQGLEVRGWKVDEVEAYRAEPPPPLDQAARDAARLADAVVFTAPSAVEGLFAELGDWVPPAATAMGPTTAAAVIRAGVPAHRVAVPDDASVSGLVDALVRLLA
jgi:uroporphyrinogen III methyltransferase/synthase